MKTFLLLILALALSMASCGRDGSTRVIEGVECAEGGGFIPGSEVVSCALYNNDGALIEVVGIGYRDSDKLHCNEQARYVRCIALDGVSPAWPSAAIGPLCPFTGLSPTCPEVSVGQPMQTNPS